MCLLVFWVVCLAGWIEGVLQLRGKVGVFLFLFVSLLVYLIFCLSVCLFICLFVYPVVCLARLIAGVVDLRGKVGGKRKKSINHLPWVHPRLVLMLMVDPMNTKRQHTR